MKKKALFILMVALLGSTFWFASAYKATPQVVTDSYDSLWKRAGSYEKEGLPESMKSCVDSIFDKAVQEKNIVQQIKAKIFQMKVVLTKENDKNDEVFDALETFTSECESPEAKALLHSLLADAYSTYYLHDSYKIGNRTDMTGTAPDDIEEWSASNFAQRIFFHLKASVEPKNVLANASLTPWLPLLEEMENDSTDRLYDYLNNRLISIASKCENSFNRNYKQTQLFDASYLIPREMFVNLTITDKSEFDFGAMILHSYQENLKRYAAEGKKDKLLKMDLGRLKKVHDFTQHSTYNALLETLIENNKDCLSVMDVYVEYSNNYFNANSTPEELRKKYNLCKEGALLYPSSKKAIQLRNRILEFEQPNCNMTTASSVFSVNEEIKLSFVYKNISYCDVEIYPIPLSAADYAVVSKDEKLYKTKFERVKTVRISFPDADLLTNKDTSIVIPGLPAGIYEVVLRNEKAVSDDSFTYSLYVTDYAAIYRNRNGVTEVVVTDRKSGKPAKGVQVNVYIGTRSSRNWNQTATIHKEETLKTNQLGMTHFSSNTNNTYYFSITEKGKGEHYLYSFGGSNFVRNTEFEVIKRMNVLTDRSIYRPGQTVYFKGVGYDEDENGQRVMTPHSDFLVKLVGANGDELSEQTLKSNEFGSISGSFVIPTSSLNGQYRIVISGVSNFYAGAGFRVEEYKRPTFEVVYDTIKATYKFGDPITVTGKVKSYSGAPVQQAEIKYRVSRKTYSWYYDLNSGNGELLTQGICKSDDAGAFTVTFVAEKENTISRYPSYYTYQVAVDATDNNGETQSQTKGVNVGDRSLLLSVEAPNYLREDTLSFAIHAKNLDGMNVSSNCSWSISQLKDYESMKALDKGDSLGIDKLITSGKSLSDKGKVIVPIQELKSGRYRIRVESTDNQGRKVIAEQEFIRYTMNDKKLPVLSKSWLATDHLTCLPGEKAVIQFGSSFNDVSVLYEIISQDYKILTRKWLTLDNECLRLEIPFKDEYGKGVNVRFTFIREGMIYQKECTVQRFVESKSLWLKMASFRDKIRPGSTESWTLTVTDDKGKFPAAEVLASMYDMSLDKFVKHQFSPFFYFRNYESFDWRESYKNNIYSALRFASDREVIPSIGRTYQNWMGLLDLFRGSITEMMQGRASGYLGIDKRMSASSADPNANYTIRLRGNAAAKSVESGDNEVQLKEVAFDLNQTVNAEESVGEGGNYLRTNLNETAFFYPHLVTDATGNVAINFTVPESLTRWKFMAMAHTKDMKWGTMEELITAQKEVMITPNLPRFFRQGDITGISGKVDNLSAGKLTMNVILEFFDPSTEIVLAPLTQQKQITIDGGKSQSVAFQTTLPDSLEIVGVRMKALSNTYSDGEQVVIPVLSNRQMVTESMPMSVRGNKAYTFDMKSGKKSKTQIPYRMVFEFSTNPVWYAIQALPSIGNPRNENDALSWFSAYYASIFADAVLQTVPQTKQIFEQWRSEGKNKESLLSNLEKNQDLKTILLEESPWLLDGKKESEQKERIGLLFDLNNQKQQRELAIRKLIELQTASGGWSWYPGMPESRYITQFIIGYMSKIQSLGTYTFDNKELSMIMNGLKYLDDMIAEDYIDLKKSMIGTDLGEVRPNIYQLYYLFARSNFIKLMPLKDDQTKEAADYYLAQVEKFGNEGPLFNRALSAITLSRNGKTTKAKSIVRSLREQAVQTEELGMYWKKNVNGYFWNENAIAVHVVLMQALSEVDPNETEQEELKIWLLKQKQTENWGSSTATSDAISALVMKGSSWANEKGKTEIHWGGREVQPEQQESGTGYFRQVLDAKEITPEHQKVTVRKEGKGIAWGALYYQYSEVMENIKGNTNALQVSKKLLRVATTPTGNELQEIGAQHPLEKGEKVTVRLVVKTDRDMEFVHLKDARPSCLEATDVLSKCIWKERICYYQSNKDASMNFYFNFLPKGTYVFEYSSVVTRSGTFSEGPATIQCMYAPEFTSHTSGNKIFVK
ncbi:MAG: alpha-2-macroglobulin family protein [Bacteroidales bacterium]|nr:alpha-2-macroglobulin family protein [Bacteroidales bacterium]